MIGIPGVITTVIESFGSTSLVEVGTNFYLNSISSGSGPELKYGGTAVAAGQFGTWTPIGAEVTATGYEIAWKDPVSNQYSVWLTDSNGNETSNTGALSGTSTTLEQYETSFHQDLNGDGVIGIPSGVQPATTAVSLAPVATVVNNDTFVFAPRPGAAAVANAGSPPAGEASAFWQNVLSEHSALLHALGPTQAAFVWDAINGHETSFNFMNHDSVAQPGVHLADLHAGFILVH